MPQLTVTAAQATLITAADTNLENAFQLGVKNSGTGSTILPAMPGYSVDTTIGGGIASKAASARTLIRQSEETILAALLVALNIGQSFPTVSAKGDLFVGSGANALTVLSIGTDGQSLIADAASPGGVKWGAGSGGAGGTATTLHDRTGKTNKMWGLQSSSNAAFIALWANGPTSFGTGGTAVITSLTRYFLGFTVNGGVNNSYGYWWGGAGGWTTPQALPKFTTRVKLASTTNIANVFAVCGAGGSTQAYGIPYTPTLAGTNTDNAAHITISADSRVGAGNFIFGTGDGSTANWIDTGVAYNTTDEFLLCIDLTTASTAKCTITNCTTLAVTTVSLTTHLPSATATLGPEILCWNNQVGAQSNAFYCEYVWMDQAA